MGPPLLLGVALLVDLTGLLHGALLDHHVDGPADVVGVLLDEALELVGVEVLVVVLVLPVLTDVHDDLGTVAVLLACLDGVSVGTLGDPFVGLVGTVCLGPDDDPVGDEERGVETDTELSDDVYLLFIFVIRIIFEIKRSTLCNYAEILFKLILCHTTSVVRDYELSRILICADSNLKITLILVYSVICKRFEIELINRVAGI